MHTINFPNELSFDVSKAGRVAIDVSRLSNEQLIGAAIKGLHEFLKDAHAGVSGDAAAREAVEKKLQRLYEGTVPGLGRTGGGGRSLTALEKEMRAIAEQKFAPAKARFPNAASVKKAAADYEATLLEIVREKMPDAPHESVVEKRDEIVASWRATAERTIAARSGAPDMDIEI